MNGSNVYVTWADNRDGPPGTEAYFKRSTNNGASWEPETRISDNDGHDSTHPVIATWGDNVYLVWDDNYYESTGGRPELFFSKSTNRGEDWTVPVNLTTDDHYDSGSPDICVNDTNLHVVWGDYKDGNWETYYVKSEDSGDYWTP
ncbi:MAG: exo-alpha-sialidase, partial [Thermoplasmata archaeon]|nr:exo-alpha-sialidase [Thermoplasmata archaeon]